jgi:hypothetical protein
LPVGSVHGIEGGKACVKHDGFLLKWLLFYWW